MSSPTVHPARTVTVDGRAVAVQEYGEGEPLLIINGTSQSLGMWAQSAPILAGRCRVITWDLPGLGGSERGTSEMTVRSLAEDARALLDELGVPRAHVLGYSLGSAVAQELALAAPDRVASLVLLCTWARPDGFQRAVLAGLSHPWRTGDLETALTALGIAFSPELLSSPEFPELVGAMLPLFPGTPGQIAATVEQWDADAGHDSLDRLPGVTAPTLVIAGEQDLLTPHWHGRQVAEAIPGARFELFTGPGSSHAVADERAAEVLPLILGFLADHPMPR